MGALEAIAETESLRAVVGWQRVENATRIEARGSTCMTDRSAIYLVNVEMDVFCELYILHCSRCRAFMTRVLV
jgi:pantothenate kinase-related protein Tda10